MSDYNVREFIEDMINELGLTGITLMGRAMKVIASSPNLPDLKKLAAVANTVGISNKKWSESTYSGDYRWRFGSPYASIFDEEPADPN